MSFAYRCYSCGEKLGDGLPPAEALDFSQRAAIGETDGTALRIDGKSGYSYCTFCLLFEQEYGTMDRLDPHTDDSPYSFSDYGRVIWVDWPEAEDSYFSPVLANRILMVHGQNLLFTDLPKSLLDILLAQMVQVEQMQRKIDADNKKREREMKKLHNRIKSKIRTIKLQLLEEFYHLIQGWEILWETVTFPRNLTPEEVDERRDVFYWDSHNWYNENRITEPFAKFELWALNQRAARFDRLYKETEEVHFTEEDFPATTKCTCGHMASTHDGFCRFRTCKCIYFVPRNYKENN